MTGDPPRLCFVVPRYGADVLGGAESLCRQVANRLSGRYRITVLTTCARDYLTWRDEYPPGESDDGGVRVVRFPVVRPRRVRSFGRLSQRLYRKPHLLSEEMDWMERQGPDSPALTGRVESSRDDHDLFVFFTYLYATTFFPMARVADRSVLVPMAHPEEPLALGIFRYLFGLPRGFLFNTPEERDLVVSTFRCGHLPHAVAGVGITLPAVPPPPPDGTDPYLLFTGRLDVQKGLDELFAFFARYRERRPDRPLRLLLAGEAKMRIPRHESITHLGYLPEAERDRVLAGALAAVVPSPHESLSMTALEAWAHGRPVVANGRSEVLAGQCRRSGGGLVYAGYEEFEAALDRLLGTGSPAAGLGAHGREFVAREYSWEVIEGKYADFLDGILRTVHAG
jgi:glycosyltransferase involved in cell wall biosynthesis